MFDATSSAHRNELTLRHVFDRSSTNASVFGPTHHDGHSSPSEELNSIPQEEISTPVSATSTLLLGMQNCKAFESVDLPEFVKEHQATLTFPEKLMLMLMHIDKEIEANGADPEDLCISWILDGRAFIIRRKEEMVKQYLSLFFRQSKFPSFTRKLYRWGFRQVTVAQERSSPSKQKMIFGHEYFQRDSKNLLGRMRSVTAAGKRRAMLAMSASQRKSTEKSADHLQIEPKTMSIQPITLSQASGPLLHPAAPLMNSREQQSVGQGNAEMALEQPTLKESVFLAHQQRHLQSQHYDSIYGKLLACARGNGIRASEQGTVGNTSMELTTFDAPFAAAIAAAQEQMINHQAGISDSTQDPNAFMRAAVDLLLRYAS